MKKKNIKKKKEKKRKRKVANYVAIVSIFGREAYLCALWLAIERQRLRVFSSEFHFGNSLGNHISPDSIPVIGSTYSLELRSIVYCIWIWIWVLSDWTTLRISGSIPWSQFPILFVSLRPFECSIDPHLTSTFHLLRYSIPSSSHLRPELFHIDCDFQGSCAGGCDGCDKTFTEPWTSASLNPFAISEALPSSRVHGPHGGLSWRR